MHFGVSGEHRFHQECFDDWSKVGWACPICRHQFREKPVVNNNEELDNNEIPDFYGCDYRLVLCIYEQADKWG